MIAQAPADQTPAAQDSREQGSPDSAAGGLPDETAEVLPPPAASESAPPEASSPPDREQPTGLPWERDEQAGKDSGATSDLFNAVNPGGANSPAAGDASAEEATPKEEEDGMEAFLRSQYGDLLGEEEAPAEPEPAEPDDGAPKEAAPSLANTPPTKSLTEISPEDLWSPAKNELAQLAQAPPELPPLKPLTPATASQTPMLPEPLPEATVDEPLAKPPTTTAPATSLSQEDLWADTPAEPVEASLPEPEPTPGPVVTNLPEPLPPPADFEPAAPAPPAEAAVVEAPARPDPLPETPTETPRSDPPPRVASRAPLASDAIDELPGLPVAPYNTRHLAWLLGGKIALAELADLDGATPAETAAWADESKQLAQQLGVRIDGGASPGASATERVQRLIGRAGTIGRELARRHGDDHAALLEIAVKTNALLVLATERPELAGPVGRSVRNASERALLPRYLWESAVRSLNPESSPKAIHNTVVRLHERVEPFLR